MKLPENTLIAHEKQCLLVMRKRNDKSKWLAQAGYTLKNWQVLESLRNQILLDATPTENTEYGQMYEIRRSIGTGGNIRNDLQAI